MNNKGQLNVGTIIMIALGVIIGAIFMIALANQNDPQVTTRSSINETITFPANGSSVTLIGQATIGSLIELYNTTGTRIKSQNYTLTSYVLSGGNYVATLTAGVGAQDYYSKSVNISYNYEPIGYNTSSGSRAVSGLTILFFALAVFGLAIPGVREWLGDKLGQ